MENALVHPAGDVEMLADHIGKVHADAALLATLRAAAIETAASFTWTAAGRELLHAYREAVNSPSPGAGRAGTAASVLC